MDQAIPIAAWITDLHLSPNTIEVVHSVFKQTVDLCVSNGVPGLILGGDIFTSRTAQPESVLKAFSDMLDYASSQGVSVVAIAGNHDKSSYISEDSFLIPYVGRPGFVLYKGYGFMEVNPYDINFHFIPYFDEKLVYLNYLEECLENVTLDRKNFLFTHIAITGVKNNDGSKVENGFKQSDFKVFHKVLIGHYHNYQAIGNNIVYTGSCYQGNFGEDEQKGCTLIYSDGTIEFIQLEFPLYKTYKITPSQFENVDKFSKGEGINKKIKLTFKPSFEQAKQIQELEAQGVKVEYEYQEEVRVGEEVEVKTKFDKADIIEYFNAWCDEEKIEDRSFALDKLN